MTLIMRFLLLLGLILLMLEMIVAPSVAPVSAPGIVPGIVSGMAPAETTRTVRRKSIQVVQPSSSLNQLGTFPARNRVTTTTTTTTKYAPVAGVVVPTNPNSLTV